MNRPARREGANQRVSDRPSRARRGARRGEPWRRPVKRRFASLLKRPPQTVCPMCLQVEEAPWFGRVLLIGELVSNDAEMMRRHIANVVGRVGSGRPERRIAIVRPHGEGLEVLTTSEKLAHRIARELEKRFGGRASYAWSHREPVLLAIWQSDAAEKSAAGKSLDLEERVS